MKRYFSQKVLYDGFSFQSKTECELYKLLKQANISFRMQVPFLLQDKFRCHNETVRKMEYIADFVIEDNAISEIPIIIDCKGSKYNTEQTFILKFKILKNKYREQYLYRIIYTDDIKKAIVSNDLKGLLLGGKK